MESKEGEDQINSMSNQQADNQEEEEMSFEQFLVYSARHGEIDDVQEMIDVIEDLYGESAFEDFEENLPPK